MNRPFSIFLFGLCVSPILLWANNVQLHDLHLIDPQHIGVTVNWEHSWRLDEGPSNHDAVWIFLKYRSEGGAWQHANLSIIDQAHIVGFPLEGKAVEDGKGLFVRRAMPGSGEISPTLLELELAAPLPFGTLDLEIYGIEMVYIPEGGFLLGDSSSFHHFREAQSGSPFWIGDEQTIPDSLLSVGSEAAIYGQIPARYPKGFGALYSMKYELSQAQYVDFLNVLSYQQQLNRTSQSPASAPGTAALTLNGILTNRNGILLEVSGQSPNLPALYNSDAQTDGQYNQVDDGQTRACNYLSWKDLLAYLDWAGLRPMSELEFEKICRGPERAVPGEFAWGTPHIIDANTVMQDGTEDESVTEVADSITGLGSHGYTGPAGPLRSGFGGTDSSDRLQIGATYYGVLEMSGNLWELCVTVDSLGLLFEGTHGDGHLTEEGEANVSSWSLEDGGIHRGGAWFSGIIEPYRDLAISDRFYHELQPFLRRNTTGGRGVRTVDF
ncbi:MAG: SUMF1/EgtB/PvdO family nonheme iron enzyme [Bacteroidota bacterium]